MAEYKYRALGWKDDDIASLNVVDGTAADNQVELKITKQGAGTIDGPAIVGKDGITINKAADSEKIEISGKGCVQHYGKKDYYRAYIVDYTGWDTTMIIRQEGDNSANTLIQRKADGSGEIVMPETPVDLSITNKKYVDEADKNLRLKLSNLEQALNGYILDTTKETYADLDSAVLKNSVAVGDNVYPIADKTRALVTRIEGKTMKMVQLANTETLDNEQIKNGITLIKNADGSLTANGTATAKTWGLFAFSSSSMHTVAGSKYLLLGSPDGYGPNTYHLIDGNGKISEGKIRTSDGSDISIRVVFVEGFVAENITFKPQLFNLTAMYGEGNEPTTVEQFKADFPNAFYPYAEGDLYSAKISGVKFTGKNLFNPSTPKYSGNSDFELDGNNITVKQSNTSTYISANFELPNAKFLIGKKISISAKCKTSDNNQGVIRVLWMRDSASANISGMNIISNSCTGKTETNLSGSGIVLAPSDDAVKLCLLLYSNTEGNLSETKTYTATYSDIQVEISDAPTPYEPYIEPVSVTLPETYDLHGIGDYKDYLEITKNENNELYTLKKIQAIDKHVFDGTEAWTVPGYELPICKAFFTSAVICLFVYDGKGGLSNHLPLGMWGDDIEHIQFGQRNGVLYVFLNKEKFTTGSDVQEYLAAQYASGNPLIAYYILPTPVETVIATNLTYEQVTAIRHNGGLIEVEGNTNKGYARPTVTNTIVYRLTATNTTEG